MMRDPVLPTGKLPVGLLRQMLEMAGPASGELLLPAAVGEDAAAIAIKGGTLIAATDPITLTSSEVGGHAVIINANDVAVMGVRPRWFLAVFLLPVGSTETQVRALFESTHRALERIGAILVGGHTEITAAIGQPVVVGQMLGFQDEGRFVRTGGVRAGDVILQIGLAPIEGAAVLANEAAERLGGLTAVLLERARSAIEEPGISVVEQALCAAELGATALHDPTEGGLSAGLYELAEASNVKLHLDTDSPLWFEPGLAISRELKVDPWGVLASGCLLAAFPRDIADAAKSALQRQGYPAAEIAHAEAGAGILGTDGRPLKRHEQDEVSRILSAPD